MGDVTTKRLSNVFVISMLIIAMSFMTSCNMIWRTPPPKEQPKPPVGEPKQDTLIPKDFFPLSEGNAWKYQGEGNEYASFDRKVLFVQGDRAQIMENNGGTISASIFKTTKEEIVRTFFQGEEYNETNLLDQEPNDHLVILKAPLKIGTRWETSEEAREIVETTATVDTPAGKFEDCIKASIQTQNSTLYEYFKAGIGMVKREFISGDTAITSTLEEYDIK